MVQFFIKRKTYKLRKELYFDKFQNEPLVNSNIKGGKCFNNYIKIRPKV